MQTVRAYKGADLTYVEHNPLPQVPNVVFTVCAGVNPEKEK